MPGLSSIIVYIQMMSVPLEHLCIFSRFSDAQDARLVGRIQWICTLEIVNVANECFVVVFSFECRRRTNG